MSVICVSICQLDTSIYVSEFRLVMHAAMPSVYGQVAVMTLISPGFVAQIVLKSKGPLSPFGVKSYDECSEFSEFVKDECAGFHFGNLAFKVDGHES